MINIDFLKWKQQNKICTASETGGTKSDLQKINKVVQVKLERPLSTNLCLNQWNAHDTLSREQFPI